MRYTILALLALCLMSTPAQADENSPDTTPSTTEKAVVVGVMPVMDAEGYFGTYIWAGPMWSVESATDFWIMFNPYGKLSPDTRYWGLGLSVTIELMVTKKVGLDFLVDLFHEQYMTDFAGAGFGFGVGPGISWYVNDTFFLSAYVTANWDVIHSTGSISPGLASGFQF